MYGYLFNYSRYSFKKKKKKKGGGGGAGKRP